MPVNIETSVDQGLALCDQARMLTRLHGLVGRWVRIRPRTERQADLFGRHKMGRPGSVIYSHHYVIPGGESRYLKVVAAGMHEGRVYAWGVVECGGDQGFRLNTHYLLWADSLFIHRNKS